MKQDFTFTYYDDGNCEPIGDIQNLLSKDNYVVGWCEDKNELTKLSQAPVYYLRVPDLSDGSCCYFLFLCLNKVLIYLKIVYLLY